VAGGTGPVSGRVIARGVAFAALRLDGSVRTLQRPECGVIEARRRPSERRMALVAAHTQWFVVKRGDGARRLFMTGVAGGGRAAELVAGLGAVARRAGDDRVYARERKSTARVLTKRARRLPTARCMARLAAAALFAAVRISVAGETVPRDASHLAVGFLRGLHAGVASGLVAADAGRRSMGAGERNARAIVVEVDTLGDHLPARRHVAEFARPLTLRGASLALHTSCDGRLAPLALCSADSLATTSHGSLAAPMGIAVTCRARQRTESIVDHAISEPIAAAGLHLGVALGAGGLTVFALERKARLLVREFLNHKVFQNRVAVVAGALWAVAQELARMLVFVAIGAGFGDASEADGRAGRGSVMAARALGVLVGT